AWGHLSATDRAREAFHCLGGASLQLLQWCVWAWNRRRRADRLRTRRPPDRKARGRCAKRPCVAERDASAARQLKLRRRCARNGAPRAVGSTLATRLHDRLPNFEPLGFLSVACRDRDDVDFAPSDVDLRVAATVATPSRRRIRDSAEKRRARSCCAPRYRR